MPLMPRKDKKLDQGLNADDRLLARLSDVPLKSHNEPVDRCIYCFDTQSLSREHIVPRSFNGVRTLPKASCATCADITKAFEQTCARENWGLKRLQQGYRSYTKKGDRPKTIEIEIGEPGTFRKINAPLSDLPLLPYAVPLMPISGILRGITKTSYISDRYMFYNPLEAMGEDRLKLYDLLKGSTLQHTIKIDTYAFMRMLAKIAFCASVSTFGLDSTPRDLVPYIIGDDRYISHLVGGVVTEAVHKDKTDGDRVLLGTVINLRTNISYLYAWIELFNMESGPGYGVVIGRANAELQDAIDALGLARAASLRALAKG